MWGTDDLSKLSILVAQLESIVAASSHQHPQPLICFDLLVDLLSTVKEEPKGSLVPSQRQCEDALQALLMLGVGPPVRRLAASATVLLIEKGDSISIYSRASSLQGWLSDKMDRKSDPASCIGVAQCLGALLRAFGQKLTSGLVETTSIVAKLMRYSEVGVRQAALALLQDALEGSGGGGAVAAYSEALRIITKLGVHDKSAVVRAGAAGCLRVFAVIGGPGVGVAGLENCCALCLKALEDSSREGGRDAFAAALGALLALGLNPQAQQAQPTGKGPPLASKAIEGGLQKHLINPFIRASGLHYKEIRVSLTMALVAFLQGMRLNYLRSDLELQEFAMQAIRMLALSPDTHSQACLLFCLRVGIIEQMGESTQKLFADHLIKQVSSPDIKPAMLVVILRTLSHLLDTLGEVPETGHDALDNSLVTMLSNSSLVVRVEAALVLRTLAEVDATSANSLLSFGVTTLRALRETVAVEKGDRLRLELDSLHGQAAMLAAILTACPRLVLGVPSRLPAAVWDVARAMVLQKNGNPISVGAENEAGWMLIASIVSSMPKEEVDEQKFDILVLLTGEFAESVEERLRRSQSVLSVHLSVWSAAVEALTAFLKSFVLPLMSTRNEGILLQPLISCLSRALAYLSSNALQEAYTVLKPAIDLFTVRVLRAFQAVPDPIAYQQDHSALLALCTAPFLDPVAYGASSCLRQLLDSRDASLGPWVPGRDSFEDELRAFEGGAEELPPCIWGYELSAFPQPLPVTTMLLDEMLLCFGVVFAAQSEKRKLQFVQIVSEAARLGKKQAWHGANITNTCVAFLRALKASISLRFRDSEADSMKQLQAILQGILGEDGVSPAERRAAAEGLGILARLGSDSYAARLTRSLLADARAPVTFPLMKGSIALALGCVHQSVGGMALSALVPATVQTLCALAKDPSDGFPVWSLHGLWHTADAAGLSYVPQVQATLALVMELLLSEDHVAPALGQSVGRLINAVVAVLGPELSPGSSLFTRCNAVVAEIGTRDEPAALLECVLFTQQLVLFAPGAVPVHTHVKTLRPTLTSRQPSLRQAAVSTLHHLSERDALAMCEERIEQDLFAMLDKETDESIILTVRSTLQRLLEEACPSLPSRWLHLCRNVVLSASTTKSAAAGFKGPSNSQLDTDIDAFGDDDQGMIMENTSAGQKRARGENDAQMKDMDQLPRFKTRVFAAECLRRLPVVVGVDPRHFDLGQALQSPGDWLVLHLGELVAVAYQVATGALEIVRPMGIELLDVIVEKFGKTQDPMYEGHLLLEQYQAQFFSAARAALDPAASPLLVASGSKLVSRIITSGNSGGDGALLQRMVGLLTRQLLKWDDIMNPNYAEWVGCKVQVTLLGAHASLKTYAFTCSKGGTKRSSDGMIITPLLAKHADILGRYWVGLLRDFTALRLHPKMKLPNEYQPFLDGIQTVTIAHTVEQYLAEVWSVVLEAVTVDARAATGSSSQKEDEDELHATQGAELTVEEFHQVWALSVLMLSNVSKRPGEMEPTATDITSHSKILPTALPELSSRLAALSSLRCLCRQGFYTPDMISQDLCNELLQIISTSPMDEKVRAASDSAVLSLVDQIVRSCPGVYTECKEISSQVIELCLEHVSQVPARNSSISPAAGVDKLDDTLSSALQTLGNLVGRWNGQGQGQLLLPQLLSSGITLLKLLPVNGRAPSAAVGFMTSVTAAISRPVQDSTTGEELNLTTRASILAAAVESMARLSTEYAEQATRENDEMESMDRASIKRVRISLDVMAVMVSSVPDVDSAEQGNFRKAARACCISCLQGLLSSGDVQVQLAALQTVGKAASSGSTGHPGEEGHTWAILLLREVGADVMQIVHQSIQKSLTTASAAAVAEGLKLLILWHSIVEGDEAQRNVLHLLLPAMIGAATAENEDNNSQSTTPLRTAALKLVTRLASAPSSASQFRTVMLELRPESRLQLQTLIKASMQQPTAKTELPPPAPPPLEFPKPLKFPTSNGGKPFLPPPSSSSQPPPVIKHAQVDDGDDDWDDDWDDFQVNTDATSELEPAVPEADKKMIDEASEVESHAEDASLPSQFQPNHASHSPSSPKGLKAEETVNLPGGPSISDPEGHHYEAGNGSTSDSGSHPKSVPTKDTLKLEKAGNEQSDSESEGSEEQTSPDTPTHEAHISTTPEQELQQGPKGLDINGVSRQTAPTALLAAARVPGEEEAAAASAPEEEEATAASVPEEEEADAASVGEEEMADAASDFEEEDAAGARIPEAGEAAVASVAEVEHTTVASVPGEEEADAASVSEEEEAGQIGSGERNKK